ncbi:MAG TPA: hypothetical protein VMU32_03480 [Solirubrobacteraceae bacterium]|nr:hypothetical protein [Solirubrobacteraceae bacterium]
MTDAGVSEAGSPADKREAAAAGAGAAGATDGQAQAGAAAAAARRHPPGFWRARGLVVLASILLIFSIMATWIRAQIIDTEGWTQTSVRLLQNEKVREAVAGDLSERLLSVVDVQNLAAEKLPPALRPLAPALSTAAAQVVPQAIERALQIPAVQEIWGRANHITHEQVMKVLSGGTAALSTQGGVVSINLEVLLDRIGSRLGVGSEVGSKLPPNRRKLDLLRSNELKLAQDGVKALRDLSFILPLLVVLMYLGAIAIARGYRRKVLVEIGVGVIAGALVALLLRRWIDSYVVNSLVHNEGLRPAIGEALDIATAGWRSRALWLLITGVVFIFAGLLAGPMRWAVWVRRRISDPLDRHPAWFATGVLAIVLILAMLGPTRTPGQTLPLLIELVLAAVGVYALRRQVIRERDERAGSPPSATPAVGASTQH